MPALLCGAHAATGAADVAAAGVLVLAGTMLSGIFNGTTTRAYATATAGCGKAPTLTSGTKTIQSSGQNRTYILDIPTNYDSNRPYRLIFGLHWLNGTASNVATGGSDGAVWAFYGQKQLSNNSTIFVAPQGINNGWANTNGQDVTLIDNILNLVEADLCIETTQVYAMGWSYGGAMSYALACARPAVFRAVVVYSGAQLSGCNGGTQPVAYFGIHGTHDSVLNISNGRSLRDTFVRNNGCTSQSPREPAQNSLTHITTTYSGLPGRLSGPVGRVRRRPHPQSGGRIHHHQRRQDLDLGRGEQLPRPVPELDANHATHNDHHEPATDDNDHHESTAVRRRLLRHLPGHQLLERRLPGNPHHHRRQLSHQRMDTDLDPTQRQHHQPTLERDTDHQRLLGHREEPVLERFPERRPIRPDRIPRHRLNHRPRGHLHQPVT